MLFIPWARRRDKTNPMVIIVVAAVCVVVAFIGLVTLKHYVDAKAES